MSGPYINSFGKNKVKTYYNDIFMPWVAGGGPSGWDREVGTPPGAPPKDISEEEQAAIMRLLLTAFGGKKSPGYKRFDAWTRDADNMGVHGSGMWDILSGYETP